MVRLEDGSEVGPLETDMVRRWYEQGLINSQSPVLPPGSKRWEKLGAVVNVQAWGGYADAHRQQTAAKARLARAKRQSEPAAAAPPAEEPRPRTRLVGGLCLAVAGAAAFAAFAPERMRPEFAALPWKEMALGLAACGLALVPGWKAARLAVRSLMLLASFAVLGGTGILLAQGVRGEALLVPLGALLLTQGLFLLLARGPLHWAVVASGLLLGVGGLAVAIRFLLPA